MRSIDELDNHFQQLLVFDALGVVYTAKLDAKGMKRFFQKHVP